jgi:hypothetical protein
MNALPPSFPPVTGSTRESFAQAPVSPAALRWGALGEAASVVATLAGLEPEWLEPEVRDFPALIRDAEAWRRERAENSVADLAAIMEPGIAALLAVNARGADPRPAAMALWREFVAARTAILALLPPGPCRNA